MATATPQPRYGESLLAGKTYKVMLTTSAYNFDVDTHRFRSSVTNEISATGYTAGGATVTHSVAYNSTTDTTEVSLDADVTWADSAIVGARKAVVYESVGSAATDPIVTVITFDADKSSSVDGVFTLKEDASGDPLFTFQAA
jgi:hypothetical protein